MRPDRWLGAAVALATLFLAGASFGYCRTTTCDASASPNCTFGDDGCLPLYWASKCLSFGVQQDGSAKLGIDHAAADAIITTAYQQWLGVDCGGAAPSFQFWNDGKMVCAAPEWNDEGPNANVWMFRDGDWPYRGANTTLALTTVTFATRTGEILDADVELNSFSNDFTTSDFGPGTDLQSIATHEAGHFLGLAHATDTSATMYPAYVDGDRSFRTLGLDDATGICDTYPPNRSAQECTGPSHAGGFSRECAGASEESKGCSCELGSAEGNAEGVAAALGALAVVVARARRRRTPAR